MCTDLGRFSSSTLPLEESDIGQFCMPWLKTLKPKVDYPAVKAVQSRTEPQEQRHQQCLLPVEKSAISIHHRPDFAEEKMAAFHSFCSKITPLLNLQRLFSCACMAKYFHLVERRGQNPFQIVIPGWSHAQLIQDASPFLFESLFKIRNIGIMSGIQRNKIKINVLQTAETRNLVGFFGNDIFPTSEMARLKCNISCV